MSFLYGFIFIIQYLIGWLVLYISMERNETVVWLQRLFIHGFLKVHDMIDLGDYYNNLILLDALILFVPFSIMTMYGDDFFQISSACYAKAFQVEDTEQNERLQNGYRFIRTVYTSLMSIIICLGGKLMIKLDTKLNFVYVFLSTCLTLVAVQYCTLSTSYMMFWMFSPGGCDISARNNFILANSMPYLAYALFILAFFKVVRAKMQSLEKVSNEPVGNVIMVEP